MLSRTKRIQTSYVSFTILFVLLVSCFTTSWGQQRMAIELADTLIQGKKVSFVSRKFRPDYGKICRIDGSFYTPVSWRTFSLIPSHFFWSNQFDDNAYHEVLFVLDSESGEHHLFIGTSKDTVLTEIGRLSPNGDNHLDLNFIPIEKFGKDTIQVSVSVEINKNRELVFFPSRIFKGYLELPDTVFNFYIWPYQTGPNVTIDTGDELRLTTTEIAYRMSEPFIFGNQVIRFDSFDYIQKTLSVRLESLEGNERLEGYKVGYYLPNWNTGFTDALGIQRNQPTMLYFGGSWCPPCLEELPRWKRVAIVCDNNGIGTASVAVLYKETEEEAGAYLVRHEFPGLHLVEDMSSKDTTLRGYLQINSFPSYVFIDSSGKILLRVENRGDRDTLLPSFLSKYVSDKRK